MPLGVGIVDMWLLLILLMGTRGCAWVSCFAY